MRDKELEKALMENIERAIDHPTVKLAEGSMVYSPYTMVKPFANDETRVTVCWANGVTARRYKLKLEEITS